MLQVLLSLLPDQREPLMVSSLDHASMVQHRPEKEDLNSEDLPGLHKKCLFNVDDMMTTRNEQSYSNMSGTMHQTLRDMMCWVIIIRRRRVCLCPQHPIEIVSLPL